MREDFVNSGRLCLEAVQTTNGRAWSGILLEFRVVADRNICTAGTHMIL